MSDLNHIELPASVIAELYRSALIDTGEAIPAAPRVPVAEKTKPVVIAEEIKPTVTAEAPAETFRHLGQNQKNILIVVNYADAVYLPDDALSFLTSMLTACHLSLADVAIINRHNQVDGGYKEAMAKFRSKTVLLFGVEPATFEMPLVFPHFQVQTFAGTTFLFSPTLEECKTDKLVKSKLWVCLQRIFDIQK